MTDTPDAKQKPSPPRTAQLAAGAVLLSGLASIGTALGLLGQKDFLRRSNRDTIHDAVDSSFKDIAKTSFGKSRTAELNSLNDSINALPGGPSTRLTQLHSQVDGLKDKASGKAADKFGDVGKSIDSLKDLSSSVDTIVKTQIIATLIALLAMAFVAMAVYRGRPWARWGTVGLWVLASFSGTFAGFTYLLGVGSDAPIAFKGPAFLASLLFVAAVVLVNLKPSVAYFNSNKPDPGERAQRRGLFAPREPATRTQPTRGPRSSAASRAAGRAAAAANAAEARKASGDRARTKQRTSADAVAKGADLARSRAKAASKSRRTGT